MHIANLPSRIYNAMQDPPYNLAKVDQVAYIRFASVYESFTDIASFEKALRMLKRKD
jgi:transcriptional regulator NrdR family protein